MRVQTSEVGEHGKASRALPLQVGRTVAGIKITLIQWNNCSVFTFFEKGYKCLVEVNYKVGGLDLSRRDLDRDLNLDAQKVSVSTVKKISTVFKS